MGSNFNLNANTEKEVDEVDEEIYEEDINLSNEDKNKIEKSL